MTELKSERFQKIFPHLGVEFQLISLMLEAQYKGEERKLHRWGIGQFTDKRFLETQKEVSHLELIKERKKAIEEGNLDNAFEIGNQLLKLWPFRLEFWNMQLYISTAQKKYDIAFECLMHMSEIEKGKSLVKNLIDTKHPSILFLNQNQLVDLQKKLG